MMQSKVQKFSKSLSEGQILQWSREWRDDLIYLNLKPKNNSMFQVGWVGGESGWDWGEVIWVIQQLG